MKLVVHRSIKKYGHNIANLFLGGYCLTYTKKPGFRCVDYRHPAPLLGMLSFGHILIEELKKKHGHLAREEHNSRVCNVNLVLYEKKTWRKPMLVLLGLHFH